MLDASLELVLIECYRDLAQLNINFITDIASLVNAAALLGDQTLPSCVVIELLEKHQQKCRAINKRVIDANARIR